MRKLKLCTAAIGLALTLAAAPSPALAGDDTEKGLIAGLGLAAAGGKTTLAGGAGAIEAGILNSEAFQQAGAIIASKVNGVVANDAAVLILARDEKLDMVMPGVILERIKGVTQILGRTCLPKPAGAKVNALEFKFATPDGVAKFFAADAVGAGAVDTAISPITLTAEDRLLINSILMNAAAPASLIGAGWEKPAVPAKVVTPRQAAYRLPSDLMASPDDSNVRAAYLALLDALEVTRGRCEKEDGKATLASADAFVNGLNAVSDKAPAPLASAILLENLAAGTPHILRVAIEQVGGTSIARTGIIYTFGWPDAATVGAGLVVSFRLTDPRTGKAEATGIVRCFAEQTNIKKVGRKLDETGSVACASKVAPVLKPADG